MCARLRVQLQQGGRKVLGEIRAPLSFVIEPGADEDEEDEHVLELDGDDNDLTQQDRKHTRNQPARPRKNFSTRMK